MDQPNQIDKNTILEQYKLYIEMADRISQRRQSSNNYFLSVNTLLISCFTFMTNSEAKSSFNFLAISLAGWVLCFVWYRLIRSYKDLNSGKFKVVHEMEKILGYSPYDREWDKLGRGKDKALYLPFTNIEPFVPFIFSVLYLISILASNPWDSIRACFN